MTKKPTNTELNDYSIYDLATWKGILDRLNTDPLWMEICSEAKLELEYDIHYMLALLFIDRACLAIWKEDNPETKAVTYRNAKMNNENIEDLKTLNRVYKYLSTDPEWMQINSRTKLEIHHGLHENIGRTMIKAISEEPVKQRGRKRRVISEDNLET